MYHLDNELPGAHGDRYWHIHLISFPFAIQTAKNVILMSLLFAAARRLITSVLLLNVFAKAGLEVRSLSNSLKCSDGISLLVLCPQTLFHGHLFHLADEYFVLKKAGVCVRSASWSQMKKCSFFREVGGNASRGAFSFLSMSSLWLISENTEWSYSLTFLFINDLSYKHIIICINGGYWICIHTDIRITSLQEIVGLILCALNKVLVASVLRVPHFPPPYKGGTEWSPTIVMGVCWHRGPWDSFPALPLICHVTSSELFPFVYLSVSSLVKLKTANLPSLEWRVNKGIKTPKVVLGTY